MRLKDLSLISVYDSSTSSIIGDFLVPCLRNSIFYDRGVGFFSSGWLREASSGMADFAENGGRARWITSPILEKADWQAIVKGQESKSDEYLKELLWQQINDLEKTLNEDTLIAISWMVADEIITFKIALPTERLAGGDFHDKFGIFQDSLSNRVSFSGSYNDSIKGSFNYESIKVFRSWDPALRTFVEQDSKRFEKLWCNEDINVRVHDIPDAIKERIIRFRRKGNRPYKLNKDSKEVRKPQIPKQLFPRDYQQRAVKAWVDNEYKGILHMATGTGKTITALLCLMELLKNNKFFFVIVACPYIHLVDQWASTCQNFNLDIVRCYESSEKWYKQLKDKIQKVTIKQHLNMPDSSVLVAAISNASFVSQKFQSLIDDTDIPIFFISDEVHHLGSATNLSMLPGKASFRLGLSATPERWYDESGTSALYNYFSGVVFSLNLKQAIYEYDVLCKYTYKICTVELEKNEFERYKLISTQITRRLRQAKINVSDSEDEVLGHLLRERANILNNAAQKLPLLERLLTEQERIDYTLIYSSPDQLPEVNRILSEKHIISHQITYRETSSERAKIISGFENGTYKVLTAIKCLDEGVDIPKIKTAFLLASTGNPREFTQRRGRILRKSENKKSASITDFVCVPTFNASALEEDNMWAEKAILRREFSRLHHFAKCAENKHEALLAIYDLARLYGVQDTLVGG